MGDQPENVIVAAFHRIARPAIPQPKFVNTETRDNKKLRIDLWAKPLNLDHPDRRRSLEDGVTSAQLWLSPPIRSHSAPFNALAPISANEKFLPCHFSWEDKIDTDGA